ncbi:hypothetical protein ACB092_03G110100 [Castanea dentata]
MHWGSLIEVDIDTPNLCKFAYCGRNVIPFSSNALALSEVTYQMLKPPLEIPPWNVEKIEFLTKLGKSKQLTLTSTSAKFSYDKPILEGKKPSCCKFLPIPCWRHCLKSVMIENFRMSADEETQRQMKKV